jgi:hypothetical protein
MRARPLILAALATLLAACGSSAPPPAEPRDAAREEPADTGLYSQEMAKAKAVEGQVLEQKDELDKAIDEQGD